MDNQTIDVVSEGKQGILHALSIIWNAAAPGGKATHYKVCRLLPHTSYYCDDENGKHKTHHFTNQIEHGDGVETLILFWSDEHDAKPLPFPLNLEQAAGFIVDWLGSVDFGTEPDHDGSNHKGWRLFTEDWGHVAGNHYTIIAAQPAWAMYGK